MNKRLIFFIVFSGIMLPFSGCRKDKPEIIYETISEIPPGHPRILLTEGKESYIRQAFQPETAWNSADSYIKNECSKIISKPPVERVLLLPFTAVENTSISEKKLSEWPKKQSR